MKDIFNFLTIFGCGAFTGMLLTIGMSFGRFWKSLSPEELLQWFSTNPKGAARPLGVVLVPTLLGLAGALCLQSQKPTVESLLIGSASCLALLLTFTVVYFFPVNGRLENKRIAPALVPVVLDRWLTLHWIRIGLSVLAGILAFVATISSISR
jgi:Domain of unknown function (DUF1772)